MNQQVWLRGSHMYGLNTEESDKDYTTVWFDPARLIDPFQQESIVSKHDNNDVIMPLPHYMRMLVAGNFNALDLVFHDPLQEDEIIGGYIKTIKRYAITSEVARAYLGYIKTNARLTHAKHQNPTRKAWIGLVGYDPKFMMHLYRGVLTLRAILRTGEYHMLTTAERNFLLAVRRGEYPLEKIQARIKRYSASLELAYGTHRLPSNKRLIEESKLYYFSLYGVVP